MGNGMRSWEALRNFQWVKLGVTLCHGKPASSLPDPARSEYPIQNQPTNGQIRRVFGGKRTSAARSFQHALSAAMDDARNLAWSSSRLKLEEPFLCVSKNP